MFSLCAAAVLAQADVKKLEEAKEIKFPLAYGAPFPYAGYNPYFYNNHFGYAANPGFYNAYNYPGFYSGYNYPAAYSTGYPFHAGYAGYAGFPYAAPFPALLAAKPAEEEMAAAVEEE